jgi:hypothetical protein
MRSISIVSASIVERYVDSRVAFNNEERTLGDQILVDSASVEPTHRIYRGLDDSTKSFPEF